ncbi:MAG: hypothetical protein ACOC1K_00885 [Nanoarchaeota archaeon]
MEYFINADRIREKSIVDKNVSDKIIYTFLKKSQNVDLQQLLGRNLYKRLQNGIVNNDLTEKEIILLKDYIEDYLIVSVEQLLIEGQMINLNSSGLSKNTPNNTSNLTMEELRVVFNSKTKEVMTYQGLIVEYIEDVENQDDFPTYKDTINYIKPAEKKSVNVFFMSDYLDSIENRKRTAHNNREESI